ncbi:MAG: FAD:protein FMN transferase [Rhodobacter sp.]|nr:FAD:protein FMN transferase [Rhodobacter sp.]
MHPTRRFLLQSAAAAGLGLALPLRVWGLASLGGHAFGSYWRVVAADEAALAGVADLVDAIVAETDAAMSPYRAKSELTRINRNSSTDWLPLSRGLNQVLRGAVAVATASGGAFDPTVGPIVGRYGFGPIRGLRVGDVGDLDLRGGTLRKGKPGLTLDLCGIAKGWALDRIVTALQGRGATGFLVELGGEVAARGRHPAGRPWRIAVDGTDRAVELTDRAVATSGDGVQAYGVGTNRYGHIIDPQRGLPATGDLASVSVIATEAMVADGWATALFALGTDAALGMAETQGLDTVLVVRDGAGYRILTTGGADRRLLM